MSDTPRTDAVALYIVEHSLLYGKAMSEDSCEVVPADLARTIERELAAKTAQAEMLAEAIDAQITEHDEMYNAACQVNNVTLAGWQLAQSRRLCAALRQYRGEET